MVTWKVTPVLYPPTINYILKANYPCRVCGDRIVISPIEVLALCCSGGGAEWAKLRQDILLPVHVCSTLCADMFILSMV